MKRLIIITMFVLMAVSVFATPPHLEVEQLFDGRYNKNMSVSTSIYRNNGNYYRGLTVKDNPAVVARIAEAVDKDAARASDYSDHTGDDGRYISLKIINNGETIYIGLRLDGENGAFFFIQGKKAAFE